MHEIAEKSEFAIGTLYKFFKNKEDLYRALILEQTDKFHNELMQAIEEPDDDVEKLNNYIRVKSEIFRDNISMIRLYSAESQGASFNIMAGLDAEIREKYEQFLQTLASVFERGIERKRFRNIADPYHLAVAFESLVNAFLFLWVYNPDRHPHPEVPDSILNVIFNALVNP